LPEAVWTRCDHSFQSCHSVFSLRALIHEFERRSLKIIHEAEYNAGHKVGINEITIRLKKQYGQSQGNSGNHKGLPLRMQSGKLWTFRSCYIKLAILLELA
jgi:hypothetical protein